MSETEEKTVDIAAEKERFLCSFTNLHTKQSYEYGLGLFELWLAKNGETYFSVDSTDADNFICSVDGSPSTVRVRVAPVSSFYSFLEDEGNLKRNPFRGTRARPVNKPVRKFARLTERDVKVIIENARPKYALMFSLMANDGLKRGELPEIEIKNGRYRTWRRDKEILEELSAETKKVFDNGNFKMRPFLDYKKLTEQTLGVSIRHELERLKKNGVIEKVYSPNCFRNFFSHRLYRQTDDVYLTKRKMHFASLVTAEQYLRKQGERV